MLTLTESPGPNERLLEIIHVQNEIVASDLDLEAAMALIVERAVTLTDAGGAAIAIPEGGDLSYAAAGGAIRPEVGVAYPRGGSLGGLCLDQGQVLRSDDCLADPRVDDAIYRRIGARSIICVPLVHNQEELGVLSAFAPTVGFFGHGDVRALELVGETISAHLHHARSFAAEAHRSNHDALTGLLNRRAYEERLPIELARADRAGEQLALCLLDLDGFKAINDDHGHPVGDEVLRAVAAAIKRTRISDGAFRIGGDEFAILLPASSEVEAEVAIARLLTAIDVGPLLDLAPEFGVSYGIAVGNGSSPDLHVAADRALVDSKHRLYGRQPPGLRRGANLRAVA